MGLDTSHGCWHGAYSAFNRFRNALAEAAGYRMRPPATDGRVEPDLPWEMYADENFNGDWSDVPEDPLLILIVHSDCDGHIKAKHAGLLADRLEELAPTLEDFGGGHLPSPRNAALEFAAGLRRAAAANEDVEFA